VTLGVLPLQGLDSVLEGHGIAPPTGQGAEDTPANRRSRELKEQEDMARLLREKKARDEMIMLQKLKDAGATDETLKHVNAAIRRRADAGASGGRVSCTPIFM
jgi:hypothetical protein